MAKIINERRTIETVSYEQSYFWRDTPGAGFSFDCDKNGTIDESKMNPAALKNLEFCRTNPKEIGYNGIREYHHVYRAPAELRCDCGRIVYLHNPLNNDCDCGRCFNMSGQSVINSRLCDEQGEPYDY